MDGRGENKRGFLRIETGSWGCRRIRRLEMYSAPSFRRSCSLSFHFHALDTSESKQSFRSGGTWSALFHLGTSFGRLQSEYLNISVNHRSARDAPLDSTRLLMITLSCDGRRCCIVISCSHPRPHASLPTQSVFSIVRRSFRHVNSRHHLISLTFVAVLFDPLKMRLYFLLTRYVPTCRRR